jgi:hypothetical protein
VDVVVTTDKNLSGTLPSGFEYRESPSITAGTPAYGSTDGGTEVTVEGTNFGAQGTITFDATPATITSWSDVEIVCVTPAHAAGSVDVVVTRDDGLDDTAVDGFEYRVPPAIAVGGITPAYGSTAGGTEVTITGFNFGDPQGTGSVTFDGTSATITSWSDVEIECVTPLHAAGLVDVVVTRDDGLDDTAQFEYRVPPAIAVGGITPAYGPMAGGTEVTIEGTNFGATQGTVTFGGDVATVSSWLDTQIVCQTPAHDLGPVPVVVTREDGLDDTEDDGFNYIPDKFVFDPPIGDQIEDVPFSITIIAQDANDNTVAFEGDITLTDLTQTISPDTVTFTALDLGVVTVDVTIEESRPADIIQAKYDDIVMGESNAFDIHPLIAKFAFKDTIEDSEYDNEIDNQTAGVSFLLMIRAEDDSGNIVGNFDGMVALSDNAGTISPDKVTFTGGDWSGMVTITRADRDVIITAEYGINISSESEMFDV